MAKDFQAKFWARIVVTPSCWIWTGKPDTHGYGNVFIKRTCYKVHRVVWELLVGEIPEGLTLDHVVCGVKLCCNPGHVEIVTRGENTRRAQTEIFCRAGHLMSETRYTSPKGKTECSICRNARDQRRKEMMTYR